MGAVAGAAAVSAWHMVPLTWMTLCLVFLQPLSRDLPLEQATRVHYDPATTTTASRLLPLEPQPAERPRGAHASGERGGEGELGNVPLVQDDGSPVEANADRGDPPEECAKRFSLTSKEFCECVIGRWDNSLCFYECHCTLFSCASSHCEPTMAAVWIMVGIGLLITLCCCLCCAGSCWAYWLLSRDEEQPPSEGMYRALIRRHFGAARRQRQRRRLARNNKKLLHKKSEGDDENPSGASGDFYQELDELSEGSARQQPVRLVINENDAEDFASSSSNDDKETVVTSKDKKKKNDRKSEPSDVQGEAGAQESNLRHRGP